MKLDTHAEDDGMLHTTQDFIIQGQGHLKVQRLKCCLVNLDYIAGNISMKLDTHVHHTCTCTTRRQGH